MEDYKIDIRLSEGPKAQRSRCPVEPFTLIGATTRLGMLTGADARTLRDRTATQFFIPAEDLELIVRRTAEVIESRNRRRTALRKSRAERAERRASRIGCCGACATSRR
jgi:Holliday junction DNA helicase RuvB